MIKKTKEYGKFKFREDNREKISTEHVNILIDSIKQRNLLQYRPIEVNEHYEVINGQHRLLAAKALDVEIYYEVNQDIKPDDMILLNLSKSWTSSDYLNYYCKHESKQYVLLNEFCKKYNLSLKVALVLTMGHTNYSYNAFKMGKYVFQDQGTDKEIQDCWDTIHFIKRMNGHSAYTDSARFWKALLLLVRHAHFEAEKWHSNLTRMVERFGPRARTEDYLRLMMEVYNWKNSVKVDLLSD